MAALWGKCPVRLGYGTLRIYHAMLLSGRLHQYEGNVGFVCRCRDKGAGFFQNWEEMMESYLLGGQFWQHEDKNDPKSMTAERWKLYEQLWQGKSRFRVLHTSLSHSTSLFPKRSSPTNTAFCRNTRNIIIMDR